ncbi:hypothetical protein GEU84_020770 [Fertoebacter nigrum]|uniref:Uncharacterized protein n=1 Tax=Fertoeibacter niger TaxID=2656921 RepID=A0A8X8KR86_9RHOB|nr:hypothetical protein [Fertoeibacter niger]NUB46821.1 hypothetical protein [Fertoeibacter niger]
MRSEGLEDIVDRRVRELRARVAASPDGHLRTEDAEARINGAFQAALSGPPGDLVLDYLRSITVNVVLPASATDQELRMQEGMRRLFGIILARLKPAE